MKGRFRHFDDINSLFVSYGERFKELVQRVDDLDLKVDLVHLISDYESLRSKVDGVHTGIKFALGEQE